MTVIQSVKPTEHADHVFDDADALFALAQKCFTVAAEAAVAENDRLGIQTHGYAEGKLVVRQPSQTPAGQ